ncbi:hypothetical protein [Roseobacter sp. AzwK-3b]|uniref:hypothetical protein n=1 Tax=Roseobacter sp. AzwK-3b TaxID=351016 RepID=UPI0012F4CF36|nr:hypothetical protein [Roseobacter sp. AzwK-3b]
MTHFPAIISKTKTLVATRRHVPVYLGAINSVVQQMADRSLGRSIRNLVLAFLNATLILTALCLWLVWGALSAAERVSEQIGEAARAVLPLRTDITTLSKEIAAARTDLATPSMARGIDTSTLEARIAGAEMQLAELTAAVTALGADPDALIETAVTSAFDSLGKSVADMLTGLRGTSANE